MRNQIAMSKAVDEAAGRLIRCVALAVVACLLSIKILTFSKVRLESFGSIFAQWFFLALYTISAVCLFFWAVLLLFAAVQSIKSALIAWFGNDVSKKVYFLMQSLLLLTMFAAISFLVFSIVPFFFD